MTSSFVRSTTRWVAAASSLDEVLQVPDPAPPDPDPPEPGLPGPEPPLPVLPPMMFASQPRAIAAQSGIAAQSDHSELERGLTWRIEDLRRRGWNAHGDMTTDQVAGRLYGA